MKHFWLFMLALILCAAMALGSVSPGVTAYKDGEIERVADNNQENTSLANCYSVSGDLFGRVTVKDATTGEVIRTFQMDDGVVVRETFLLDGGKTIAASQKDHTVFWDLATGREIRRFPDRIYGFSHDETKFFTWGRKATISNIILYSYPAMTLVCELSESTVGGPSGFQFSPDDRFLVVSFSNASPLSDEDYFGRRIVMPGWSDTKLFKIQSCQVIQEFSALQFYGLGNFSPDSSFYAIKNATFNYNGRSTEGSWQFDLRTYQLYKVE